MSFLGLDMSNSALSHIKLYLIDLVYDVKLLLFCVIIRYLSG